MLLRGMTALRLEGRQVDYGDFLDERLRPLLKLAIVLCGSRAPAEDVLQEVLLRAHQQWDRIGTVASPYGYVRTMLVNEHLAWRRRTARQVLTADPDPGSRPDHADGIAQRDDLRRRIEGLPDRQRAAVVLRYYADLDDDEIAATLGCSAVTVRSHVSRGLAALRVDLGPVTTAPEGDA
jgi:RNA polymerase sigma-70 factor (sigma-E family)